jgi:hypothetical protein
MKLINTELQQSVIVNFDTDLLLKMSEESFTLLHCKYTTSPNYNSGWWVNVHKTSFLINSASNERLEMLHAIGIPFVPDRHLLKNFGDSLQFTLVFPKIPKHWDLFHFREKTSGEHLKTNGIKRNSSGIYRVVVW